MQSRLWLLGVVAGAAILLGGVRVVATYIARDRRDPFPVEGTAAQFCPTGFYIFNETGHEILVRASTAGKVLFVQRLDGTRKPDSGPVHVIHSYHGSFPYAKVIVPEFDVLTKTLRLEESLYLRRAQVMDVKSYPERNGDFSIRVAKSGFHVSYAKYVY